MAQLSMCTSCEAVRPALTKTFSAVDVPGPCDLSDRSDIAP
jgi:hypothetical protein